MAFINLLHNGYQGKLGETVGQKWKNKRTVRTYNPHNSSKSEAQLEQREVYKEMIDLASALYATSKNLILPPGTNMNKFNFITSFVSLILDDPSAIYDYIPFKGLKNTTILFPYGFMIGQKAYIYINDPEGEIKKSLNSISVHVLFGFNSRNLGAMPVDKAEPVAIYDKSLVGVVNGIAVKKGFAIELDITQERGLEILGYLIIKKGKQRIFTAPVCLQPSLDLTNSNWVDN